MHPAEYYLKELLFDYDCVTLPGLGGFIMHSQPARINKGRNHIIPPSRYPTFNSLLNHDDGLLISCISRALGLSYSEAGLIVSNLTENCKKRLAAGEKMMLEGIGELSSGPDGGIEFRQLNQSNFLAAVFGMEPLNLYPLTTPQNPIRDVNRPVDRTARHLREKKPAPVTWTVALSLPVIVFLLYGIIFPSSIQNIYTHYSGIVYDFAYPRGDSQLTVVEASPKVNSVPEDIKVPEIISVPEILNVPDTKTETVKEPVNQVAPKYYIIGGCFENEANAEKFLADLINHGFEAEKAGTNQRGHVRISYESFPDKASALPCLQKIRNEENASAWLLKY